MRARRRVRFIYGQVGWMLASLFVLTLLGSLSLDLLFTVSFIGLLLITHLSAPFAISPQWRQRLRILIVLALIIFGTIVVRRYLAILPEGVI